MPLIIGKDPNWQADIQQRWANSLNAMTQIIHEKKAKEDRDVERQIQYLAHYPELADTLGADMVRKYGRKRPELVSLVGTLQEQNKLQKESERSLGLYDKARVDEITRRNTFAQNVDQMPDEMPMVVSPWGDTVTVPNTAKQAARSQMATLPDPSWSALSNMNPEQQLAARVAMRRNKITEPKPPETLGPKDLADSLKGLLAMGLDKTSPEFQTAALSDAHMQLSPEEEAKQKAEAAKNQRELDEKIAAEGRAKAIQEDLILQREQSQMRLTDYRENAKPKKGSPEDKAAKKDLHEAFSAYLNPRVEGTKERAHIKASISEEPPPAMTVYDQATIKDAVRKQVAKGIPADEAAQLTIHAYDGMTAEGMKPADIRKELTQMSEGFGVVEAGSSTEAAPAVNLDAIKDPKAKAWAQGHLAAGEDPKTVEEQLRKWGAI